ncbi:MAG: DNA gyrase inhibitor YacG [Pyrinomonadaceae bacterium]|nr:DNA gyrase inhibitor YacG [Pyrinomonadaceae bacterium]
MNCPNCGKPAEWKDNPFRPFCSERCKLIDFGRWANEEYRVPVAETPLAEIEEAPASVPASDDTDNQR